MKGVTRQARSQEELIPVVPEDRQEAIKDDIEKIIYELTREGLLSENDGRIEITHEALLENFPELSSYITQTRDLLLRRQRVGEAAKAWRRGKKKDNLLDTRGFAHEDCQALLKQTDVPLNSLEQEYVTKCLKHRKRQKDSKLYGSLAVAVIGFFVFTAFFRIAVMNATVANQYMSQGDVEMARHDYLRAEIAYATAIGRAEDAIVKTINFNSDIGGANFREQLIRARSQGFQKEFEVEFGSKGQTGFCLAVSANGRLAAVRIGDTLQLFETKNTPSTLAQRTVLSSGAADLEVGKFSPDGTLLVVATGEKALEDKKHIQLFSIHGVSVTTAKVTAIPLEPVRLGTIVTLVFNQKGTALAAVGEEPSGSAKKGEAMGRTVNLWDLSKVRWSGKVNHCPLIQTPDDLPGVVHSVAFHPKLGVMAYSNVVGEIVFWDYTTKNRTIIIPGGDDIALSMAFSPQGEWFVVGGYDLTVRIWQIDTEVMQGVFQRLKQEDKPIAANFKPFSQARHVLHGHTAGVSQLAFSTDGTTIASGDNSGECNIWDTGTGANLFRTDARGRDGESGIMTLSLTDNGTFLYGTANGVLTRIHIGDRREARMLPLHHPVVAVAWFPRSVSENLLATAATDGTVALWNTRERQRLDRVSASESRLYSVAVSPDGKMVATGDQHGVIKIWFVQSSRQGRENEPWAHFSANGPHRDYRQGRIEDGKFIGEPIWALRFIRKAGHNYLVSGGESNTFCIWDVNSSSSKPVVEETPSAGTDVVAIAYEPRAELLAVGTYDNTVHLYKGFPHPKKKDKAENLGGTVWTLCFNHDGSLLAGGNLKSRLLIWGTKDFKIVCDSADPAYKIKLPLQGGIFSVAFSPESNDLAIGGEDRSVSILRAMPGDKPNWYENPQLLGEHRGAVWWVTFSANSSLLASASLDHTVRIWDLVSVGKTLKEPNRDLQRDSAEATRLFFGSGRFIPQAQKVIIP